METDPAAEVLAEALGDAADSAEDSGAGEISEEEILKCTTLSVLNAESNAKFHSGQLETSLFFAAIVSDKTKAREITLRNQELLQSR